MKLFWALLVAIVLAGTAYVTLWSGGPKALVNEPPATPVAPPMSRGEPNDEAAFFPAGNPAGVAASSPAANPAAMEKSAGGTGPTEAGTPGEAEAAISKPAEPSASASKPVGTDSSATKANQGLTKSQVADAVAEAKREAETAKDGASEATAKDAEAGSSSGRTVVPTNVPEGVTVKTLDDGSVLVDERYTLRGEGTLEQPYQITWDYLTSAEETYQPRLGKKTVPGRLSMLNETYVKISGYIAFPIMATEPTEMLSMLNQWDGCCIGVPPTPYDAIEVKLKAPAEGEERLASYGAVKGRFRVDPYLVKDWLVSLYMMEEGEVSRK